MKPPSNPYAKDCEAASKYLIDFIQGQRKWTRECPVEYLVWLARWAGHWGTKALYGAAKVADG